VTTRLFDGNELIALLDPAHVQDVATNARFAQRGQKAWATCPPIENGVLRIVGHSRYPSSPGSPAAMAESMAALWALPGHAVWPDDISLIDSDRIDARRLFSSAQVTDTYRLVLARAHRGLLARFDRRLTPDAVPEGSAHLHLIDRARRARLQTALQFSGDAPGD
jgi:predicted nucleic acid-binding protein